jgi:putative PIN family toxin of toxin-antitoxin system
MKKDGSIVLDTNVLNSALRSQLGASYALMNVIRAGSLKLCCSPALFLEHADVLKRPAQLDAFGLSSDEIDDILPDLATMIIPVITHYQWRPQLRDPSDEMVLEAAVNGNATAIVTYNQRDFGPAENFGVRVLSPQQVFTYFRISKPNLKGLSS